LREKDIPYINEEFAALHPLEPDQHLLFETGVQFEIQQDFRWVNQIAYADSEGTDLVLSDWIPYTTSKDRTERRQRWLTTN
jgi:hypothetical protein